MTRFFTREKAAYMFPIRPALDSDAESIVSFDHIAQSDSRRKAFIRRAIAAGNCFVATYGEHIVGYGVLEYSFYENGFVSMLYVHPEYRRRGAGTALMRYLESVCQTAKLFTSTNLSNLPMQSLLARLGYELSGVIHNLDEGNPELVYVKRLKRSSH
jgi:ribosomal protein S18 acetylase RimI-like enzyme